MKIKNSLFLLVTSCLASAPALAAGHLTATLSPTNAGNSSVVTLTVANDGNEPVSIYALSVPTKLLDGHLPGSLYKITEVNSGGEKEVTYKGNWVHQFQLRENQFVTIDPGKNVSVTYNLSNDYALTAGKTYHVTYETYINAVPFDMKGQPTRTKLRLTTQEKITSNTLNITPSVIAQEQKSASTSYPPITDPNQLLTLKLAWWAGTLLATTAAQHYEDGAPPFYDDPNTYSVNGANYDWWFSTWNNGDSNDKLVSGTIYGIANRMMGQFNSGTPTHPVAWEDGSGNPDCASPDVAAVAQTASIASSGTYLVVICPSFFQLSQKPNTESSASQAATLVHEVSHFSDLSTDVRTPVMGYYGDGQPWMHATGDVNISAYTLSGAHNLALSNRAQAVINASNFEFYEANTPAH